jgi:hypothetical protein
MPQTRIAEFFEKNKQMLGFDSLQRSLITTIKEAVDNALDACEGHDQPDLRIHRDSLPKARPRHARTGSPGHPPVCALDFIFPFLIHLTN